MLFYFILNFRLFLWKETLLNICLFFNIFAQNITASLHYYAVDTVVCLNANTVALVFERLQSASDNVQSHLSHLKLVWNAHKRETVWFWNKKNVPAILLSITTTQGSPTQSVASYKYWGILTDDNLSFRSHIELMLKKLLLKLGLFFRNKFCLLFSARKCNERHFLARRYRTFITD